MDLIEFKNMSAMDKWDYFWDNTGDPVDSISTKNFDYFLFDDKSSNLMFELRVGKISGIGVKVPQKCDLLKYLNSEGKDQIPWE
ncbi:hypothetical protein [Flagellimonas sp.]|uniref:hypothetical protein n=1 Tax=Flagellimonas sp. TaxID=2058762 RepID=UPI003F49F0B4